ncbi:mitochondrial small ribosomal subunit Rsm22 family member protein [Theileria equi strain WA]|uniref:Mitochondrial small ribosomal subunit Rsm22 family member protein n=1 Tax=Theileria equi strain WA TaxID=1537102 RepID=L0AZH0_THEEQ|nr:mitochondrial small ribosomal subunit Rsm22 family member protein [Theileria equi strain WA]AFZ80381.1 mitochondrial small ribosomal subunit Rsm22 family member protein [Theileria equi strain WA]|eukprot:XP_004830047.1 mitochondrial small ribosomal subunit Rsm22 family member protein [Theileria equi strain WA]
MLKTSSLVESASHSQPALTSAHPFQCTGRAHFGFCFDRIPAYKPSKEDQHHELDDVSKTSIKTLPFPEDVKDKLFELVKTTTRKKDIDNIGAYISKRLAARACAELPRILPSVLLDRESESQPFDEQKYSSNPKFREFVNLYKNRFGSNEQAQIELSEAEDARHKNAQISFSPQIAVAYTAHTYFGHYAVLLRIFSEIKKRVPDAKTGKWLFYNAGPGSAIVYVVGTLQSVFRAANTIWDLNSSTDVLIVEGSENLSKVCQHLTPEIKNIRYQYEVYESTELFDVVVLPYCMTNIGGTQSRSLLVKNLWNRLNIGGMMVIVEPGTPTGFRIIHSLREMFISQLKKGNFHFVAPCPHEGICPMALTGRDWCHFSQRIFKIPHYIYKKGAKSKAIEDEKFSYIVVRKSSGPRDTFDDENHAKTTAEKSYFWPRIVLPPLKLGRRVLIDVCSAPHNFKRLIVPKNSPESGGYKHARDAIWGDLWRFTQREEKPIARGYTSDNVKEYLLNKEEREVGRKTPKKVNEKLEKQIEEEMIRNYSS